MSDNVHQPKHYQAGGIEAIDYIAAKLGDGFRDYCIGNVLKYASRYKHKNGDEDLRKASVYLAWAINGNPSLKLDRPPRVAPDHIPLASYTQATGNGVDAPPPIVSAIQEKDDDFGAPGEPPRCKTGACEF